MGLQFTRIEANLHGFFIADGRRSRGKFDEIQRWIMTNRAPIGSRLSLNVGEPWWTQDFPSNSLNHLTNQSRVEEEERIYWFLKENSRDEYEPSIWRCNSRCPITQNWWHRGPRRGPWSTSMRAFWWGSNAPHASACHARSQDTTPSVFFARLMKVKPSQCVHALPTIAKIAITSGTSDFHLKRSTVWLYARAFDDHRVDSGPPDWRELCLRYQIQCLQYCHITCKNKTHGNLVPHGRRNRRRWV